MQSCNRVIQDHKMQCNVSKCHILSSGPSPALEDINQGNVMVRKNRQYLREKSMVATVVCKHFLGGRLVLVLAYGNTGCEVFKGGLQN